MQENHARELVDRLVACDEQPSEAEMTQLRKGLQQKVIRMKQKGRRALYCCLAAGLVMGLGFCLILLANSGHQEITWLAKTGFITTVAGAVLVFVGCVGLLRYRGFGYVWAQHDYQEAAILELSLQMERVFEKLDKLSTNS